MNGPVLLYDGLCGFCNGVVQFVLRRDRQETIRFAPLQGVFAQEILARHPRLRGMDSLVLVERPGQPDEAVHARSDGAIAVAEYLGGAWSAARVLRVVPRFLRDAAYDAIARVRYRIFGRYDSCPVPSDAQRARFI